MGGLKSRSSRNVTSHPKFSVQGTTRRENDVESTFVFRGIKSAQFLSPPEFLSSPPLEVGLTKNLGNPWAKILTTNQFQLQVALFLEIY
jgi:hypothetical protein